MVSRNIHESAYMYVINEKKWIKKNLLPDLSKRLLTS